jgi:hypothetical protein
VLQLPARVDNGGGAAVDADVGDSTQVLDWHSA